MPWDCLVLWNYTIVGCKSHFKDGYFVLKEFTRFIVFATFKASFIHKINRQIQWITGVLWLSFLGYLYMILSTSDRYSYTVNGWDSF